MGPPDLKGLTTFLVFGIIGMALTAILVLSGFGYIGYLLFNHLHWV